MTDTHNSHTHCPSCNELIPIEAEVCEHCHAHKIDHYVSREARTQIRVFAGTAAAIPAVILLLSVFFTEHLWLLVAACVLLSLAAWFSVYKTLLAREKKKNITVWKRRTLTW
ncbi:hypothetical protein [Superficieibacter electus]|uniref:hypothetical protein n=1 Tax=Superficieibacter electus TaxID=2022662 RepID=UPI0010571BE3|nr:hypothetical protein [Superficieibacter electus]